MADTGQCHLRVANTSNNTYRIKLTEFRVHVYKFIRLAHPNWKDEIREMWSSLGASPVTLQIVIADCFKLLCSPSTYCSCPVVVPGDVAAVALTALRRRFCRRPLSPVSLQKS